MPKLIIDSREIEVPAGTKVIDAAERLGIMIPRFCFHPALGSLGACRVCAVKFEEGPHKGLDMSCMVEAKEGMVVSTTDKEAVDFRKYIIEWLMINHPLDCPVCDEGGHCLLQDETVSGGHGVRRYRGKKRTYEDQDLGPFVQHEMNRCIHCWRCRRFYQEFTGYRDLGAMQIGNRTYFGRSCSGALESPFSGNLIDVCPTGVFTDKPARYKGRRWDFERAPSICLHCSLGCNITGSARYREVVRVEAHHDPDVNGYFICDRGRFGFAYANHPERPRRARVNGKEVSWEQAIAYTAGQLRQLRDRAGKGAVACLGSPRSSLETQVSLSRFCELLDLSDPGFFLDGDVEHRVKRAISKLDGRVAISMREIEDSDFVLAVGVDPVHEAPMLALALRQAYRKGGGVAILDPRPVSLPFKFDHLPVTIAEMDLCLNGIMKASLGAAVLENLSQEARDFCRLVVVPNAGPTAFQERAIILGRKLMESRRPVIVCGTEMVGRTTASLAGNHALLLRSADKKAGLFYVLPGPNAFGAALASLHREWEPILDRMEKGEVRALVIVEADPFGMAMDQDRWNRALESLEFIVVLDYLPSSSVAEAHVVFPTGTVFDTSDSSFLNQEGRVQFSSPLHHGGSPVSQASKGSHPPRIHLGRTPGGEAKCAAEILSELASVIAGKEEKRETGELWAWLATDAPAFKKLSEFYSKRESFRLVPDKQSTKDFSEAFQQETDLRGHGQMELMLVDQLFGTEELSSYSQFAREAEKPPRLIMNTSDAERLGFTQGNRVSLQVKGVNIEAALQCVETMAAGVMVLPRHRGIPWQKFEASRVSVSADRIKRLP
jgi:NADH-quinone oxidoreductase subunit G